MALNVKRFTHLPSPVSVEDANFRHLVMDVVWFGLGFAATSRFANVFAIRLGGTATEVSLIQSIPALILLVGSLFGGWWTRRYADPTKAIFWPTFLFRFAFLLPAFAPIMPENLRVLWIILALSIPAIPQGVSAVVFTVMMKEAIPQKRMTSLLSARSVALNGGLMIAALACGAWLEIAPFPMNYQLMFVMAFIFQLLSLRECMAIKVENPAKQEAPASFKESLLVPWRSNAFVKVAMITGLTHIVLFSVNAIVPLHLVRTLGASEGFVAIYSIVELGAAAFISVFAGRVAKRLGTRNMIALGVLLTGISAGIVALSPNLQLTLIGAALHGFGWTIAGMVGLFAYFTENVPAEKMSEYSPVYHQVLGLTMFAAPFIGSALANSNIGLPIVLLVGAALRMLAAPIIAYGMTLYRMRIAPKPI